MDLLSGTYWLPFCWGLVLLASWIGWGEIVRRLLRVDARRAGWALRAGWGMAAVLTIAGLLQLAKACNQTILTALVLIGATAFIFSAWQRLRKPKRLSMQRRDWRAYLPLAVVLLYLYASSVVAYDLNWWDDLPNYLVYVQKILHTGTLIEPYSLRRIVTYGGQQTLDAMLLLGGNFLNIDILEMGLSRLLFAGLLLEMVRPVERRQQLFSGLAIAVLVLVPRTPLSALNTQSEMTAVVLFLTLLRTLAFARGRRNAWKLAAVAGMVAAAVCTLRANFLPAAVFSIIFCYGIRMMLERRGWKSHVTGLLIAAACCAVVLLPWSLVLYQSSGTLLYPVWMGNFRPDYAYFDAGLTAFQKVGWVFGFLGYPAGFALMAPLALALYRRFWRTELPMAIAATLCVAMTLLSFTLTEYTNLYRFAFPVVFGLAAVMILRLIFQPHSKAQRWTGLAALGLTAAMNLWPGLQWAIGERGKVWTMEAQSPLLGVAGNERLYRQAQETIPHGATVFSATSFPVLFDFQRNPIVIADVPGAVSPSPGMPIFDGAAAVKEYLKWQGIDYVIFTFPDADHTLYSRSYWAPIYNGTRPAAADEIRCSRYNYHFIQCMDELPHTGKVLFRSKTLCVVHLD